MCELILRKFLSITCVESVYGSNTSDWAKMLKGVVMESMVKNAFKYLVIVFQDKIQGCKINHYF